MNKPIGALVTFEWVDTDPAVRDTAYFSFGQYNEEADTDEFGVPDELIFYYVYGAEPGLKEMVNSNGMDFNVITYELTYPKHQS
jgi:hypothetical protein